MTRAVRTNPMRSRATSRAGEYRAIDKALLDSAEYQKLSSQAQHVLLHLMLSLGPCGIAVLYPAVIVAQTGYDTSVVQSSLEELQHSKWIRVEANVIWILEGLQKERSISSRNPKHLAFTSRCVEVLPNLQIVRDFIARYPLWFPISEERLPASHSEGLSIAPGEPIDSPITNEHKQRLTTTSQKPHVTPPRCQEKKSAPIALTPEWWPQLADIWEKHMQGPILSRPHEVEAFRRLVEKQGLEKCCTHLSNYLVSHAGSDQAQFVSVARFESTFGSWKRPNKQAQKIREADKLDALIEQSRKGSADDTEVEDWEP